MSRSSGPRTGADAFLYLVGLAVVLAVVTTYWPIFLAIAVALALAWVFTRPKPYDMNSPEAKDRRVRTFQARDALLERYGWQYVVWMAQVVDAVAEHSSVSATSLEQSHAIPGAAAANILYELERLRIVVAHRDGVRYTPHVKKVELRETAALLRATP